MYHTLLFTATGEFDGAPRRSRGGNDRDGFNLVSRVLVGRARARPRHSARRCGAPRLEGGGAGGRQARPAPGGQRVPGRDATNRALGRSAKEETTMLWITRAGGNVDRVACPG